MDKQLFQNLDFFLYSLAIGCGLAVLLTSGQSNKTAVTAFQVAYTILFCVVCYKTVITGLKVNFSDTQSTMSKIMAFALAFYPFIAVLVVILWILILVFKYNDRITGGKVSDYYSSFMNVTSILLLIQIYVIFSETDKNPTLSPKSASMLRLFAVLSSLSVITVNIILKFYVTDC